MEKVLNEILSKLDTMQQDINDIKADVAEIKSDVKRLEERITEENELTRTEFKREIQHVYDEVKSISQDLNAVEMITSKNWNEIAKLKAVK